MWKWYSMNWNKVVKVLNSDIEIGLGDYEILKRRDMYGENKVNLPEMDSTLVTVRKNVISFWSISIIIAIIGMFYLRNFIEGVLIFGIYVAFLSIIILNHNKQKKKYSAFSVINEYGARVIRDGREVNVSAEELVVGDIVVLQKNKYVPADMRLIKSSGLVVNELVVTGESYEVEKYDARMLEENIDINKINNMLFKGTIITEGEGIGIVTSVGDGTRIGNIISQIKKSDMVSLSQVYSWDKVMNKYAICSIILSLITIVINVFLGSSTEMVIRTAVVSLIALNIIPTVMIYLGIIFWNIKELEKQGIKINNIKVLEKLNEIDMIFCEKNGVVSRDEYDLKYLYVNNEEYNITNSGMVRLNKENNEEFDYTEDVNITKMFNVLSVLNDGVYDEEEKRFLGEDFEMATSKFTKENYMITKKKNSIEVLRIPINNERRVKTLVTKLDGNYRGFSIGTLENVLDMCTYKIVDGVEREFTNKDKEELKKKAYEISRKQMMVYAISYRNFKYEPTISENIESNMIFVGLIGVTDYVKEENYNYIREIDRRGIRTIISCKENKVASTIFGKSLNLIKGKETSVLGAEMQFLDKEELERIASVCNVYSNMNSNQKIMLADSLEKFKYKGLYFFNKLTDLPLMKYAHINVSYGSKISNIVKSMSDVVIKSDVIGNTIKLMRQSINFSVMYNNVAKYIQMYATAVGSFIFLGIIFNNEVVINIQSAVMLSSLVIPMGIMAIAIDSMKKGDGCFEQREDNVEIDDRSKGIYTLLGISISLVSMSMFAILKSFGIVESNTVLFFMFFVMLSIYTFNINNSEFVFKNFISNIVTFSMVAIAFTVINIDFIINRFNLQSISGDEVKYCVIIFFVLFLINLFIKNIFRKENIEI